MENYNTPEISILNSIVNVKTEKATPTTVKATAIDASLEELKLAYQRALYDRQTRTFVGHPHLRWWIEEDLKTWLDGLRRALSTGYRPSPSRLC